MYVPVLFACPKFEEVIYSLRATTVARGHGRWKQSHDRIEGLYHEGEPCDTLDSTSVSLPTALDTLSDSMCSFQARESDPTQRYS